MAEFPLRNKAKSARHGHCKECKAIYQRSWYQRNRERHIRNVMVRRERQRHEQQALIMEAKSWPCADCNRTYPPYVMDFDHVRGVKVANVSEMLGSETTKRLLVEIAKCEVVCANCHRERSYGKGLKKPRRA
ncbi:MAG: hypothetical protein M3387_07925 [Actinomycetota bacterium]|nr:hypothetical protein [Actinomycetota bacterium]